MLHSIEDLKCFTNTRGYREDSLHRLPWSVIRTTCTTC